jgi:opine dehydrogenase
MSANNNKPRTAVCGCGTGGATLAAYLTHKGFDVNLYEYPSFAETSLEPYREQGGIEVQGSVFNGLFKPSVMTTDVREAVEDVDIVMLVSRAAGHENFVRALAPVLESGQVLLCWTPYWFCMRLWDLFRQKAPEDVVFSEASIYPFMTRPLAPGVVYPDALKNELSVAAMPAKNTKKLIEAVRKVFPQTVPATNVLETSIGSPNPSIHPAPTLLNMALWEKAHGDISFYQDLQSPTVGKVLEAQDREKIAIGEALGLRLDPLRDVLVRLYGHMGARGETLHEVIRSNQAHVGFRPCKELDEMTVVLHEDIPYGLVPTSSIGHMLGVPTPTYDALIHLGGIVSGIDYWKTGSTVDKLGIGNMNARELMSYANTGEK